jgi:hypothetical protein
MLATSEPALGALADGSRSLTAADVLGLSDGNAGPRAAAEEVWEETVLELAIGVVQQGRYAKGDAGGDASCGTGEASTVHLEQTSDNPDGSSAKQTHLIGKNVAMDGIKLLDRDISRQMSDADPLEPLDRQRRGKSGNEKV